MNEPDKNEQLAAKEFARMAFPQGMELPEADMLPLELEVAGEHLTGIRIAKDTTKTSDFVFFHGASGGNYSRVMTFAKPVVEAGSSILAFDHSGHGSSTGLEKKSSLHKRTQEAYAVVDAFANKNPRTVCGSSMGGYIAIKMLEKYSVENLILYCPAVYDQDAFDVSFDSGFTEIIRKQDSWKNTDASAILRKFEGSLLVIIGSEDKTIPKGVLTLIDESAANTRKKEFLIVPGVPHAIHDWILHHPEKAQEVGRKVMEFSR